MKNLVMKFTLFLNIILFMLLGMQNNFAKQPPKISSLPKEEVALPNTSLSIGLLSDRTSPVTFQFKQTDNQRIHKQHSINCDGFKGTIKGPKDYKLCKLVTTKEGMANELSINDNKGNLICKISFEIRKSPVLEKNIIDIMDSNPDICLRVGPLDNSKHFIILVRNPWEVNP